MVSKQSRSEIRVKKHVRLRNRFSGTAERPRLAVFRSNNHMYAQIIDDTVGKTLVAASTAEKEVKAELEKTNDVAAAAHVGTVIAKRALEKGIKEGFTEGRLEGLAKGEKNIKDILTWLNKQNRNDDIIKAISDDSYMEKLKKEYEESQK